MGKGSIFNAVANGEKGIEIPMTITSEVNATTGAVAQLCINGILRVRIICTISVCDNKPSTNHPL